MDLWIRSNSGNLLEKAESIKVAKFHDESFGIIVNCDYSYGHFKTKERALEILDEIHDMDIQNNSNFKVIEYRHKPIRVVYTMPKE